MELKQPVINKLVSGARHGLIGSLGGKLLGVLVSIIAARLLGPQGFGLYAIGWTILRFMSLLFPMGMDRAVLKFAPRYWNKDQSSLKGLIIQSNLISLVSGLIFGIILYVISPWLASKVYLKPELTEIFRLFSFAFPLFAVLIVISATTRITQRVLASVLVQDVGQPAMGLVLMIIFYALGLGVDGVILAEVVSLLIASIFGLFTVYWLFPGLFKSAPSYNTSLREIIAYSLPAALGGAFSVYVFWVDRVFVGIFQSSSDNGIYLAVSQISTIFLVISAGINSVVVPIFSDLHHKGDKVTLQEVYRISTKWGIYFSAPILIVLMASPSSAISLIYGDQYQDGSAVLIILLIGQLINLVTGSINPLLIMTGNQSFLFRLSGIILVADIILNLILIPRYGLVGAAVSTSLSLSALYLYALFWAKRRLQFWPYDIRYTKGLVAGFFCVLGVVLIKTLVPVAGWIGVMIQGSVAVIIFSLVLILQKIDPEDRNIFLDWKTRITEAGK